MGYIVRMPKLGLEMKTGTLNEWYVDEGESVESGAPIAEIESEKTTAEVDAREDGVLRTMYLTEGKDVKPGSPIAIVGGSDEDIADLKAEASAAVQAEAEESTEPAAEPTAGDEPSAAESTGGAGAASSVKASPRAEKRAEELGVKLTAVEGTGPGGAITADDVEAANEAQPETAAEPTAGGATRTVVDRRTFSGMRSTIARRLGESYRDAVHVTIHRTADASALREATAAVDGALDAEVSMTDLLLVALSETLEEFPSFNATYEDGEHVIYDEHNVNLAVDVEAGLVTPVVPGVGEKSLGEVARTRRAVTQMTLAGDYTMDDLSGGTFTVSNLGHLGVEAFDPIINPPQIAILGVDALQDRVEVEDGDAVSRTVLPLDFSFDHRVVDGADAARFMGTLVDHLENPWPLVIGAGGGRAAGSAEPQESVQTTFADAERRVVTNNEEESGGIFTIGDHEYEFGLETAPTPPEIFLGSLESCLSLTLRNVALEMEIEIDSVHVDGTLLPESGAVEKIEMAVAIDAPDAPDDALAELLERGEQECHVAALLRDDLPMSITIGRP